MTATTNFSEKESIVRKVFVSVLIEIFIIMCYFYFSEIFGSISTFYIQQNEFSITFGITLFVFTFFSVLAGPIHGFVSGFLSESLYQLAFYNTISLQWIILVAAFGLMSGYYRYIPLKYQERRKIYYTFLFLVVSSLIMMFMINIIQATLSPGVDLNTIFINYGLKFLIQSLISIIFLVPLLLVLYDRLLATEKRHYYRLLLTHHPIEDSDHTFYLQFGRTKIYFCSRCSGVILGGIISIFITHLIESIFNQILSPEIAIILIISFPIPGLIDWGTQRLLFRKSTTASRFFTGFIIGAGLHLIQFSYQYYLVAVSFVALYFSIMFLMIYLGHKKQMRLFSEELDQLSSENREED